MLSEKQRERRQGMIWTDASDAAGSLQILTCLDMTWHCMSWHVFISCPRKSSRKPDTWILRKPRNTEKKAFRILQRDTGVWTVARWEGSCLKLQQMWQDVKGNTFFKANDMVAAKQDRVTILSHRYKQILDSWNDLENFKYAAKKVILAKGVWWSHPKKSDVLCWQGRQGCSTSVEVALDSCFHQMLLLPSELDCHTCWWWSTLHTNKKLSDWFVLSPESTCWSFHGG